MTRHATRIQLNHTLLDAIVALSDGNPDALRVLTEVFRDAPRIDPDSFMGGFAVFLDLDVMGIYGPEIWMLYKDVCGEDTARMLGVLRAVQLGHLEPDALLAAIRKGAKLDVAALIAQVKAELPNFDSASTEVAA